MKTIQELDEQAERIEEILDLKTDEEKAEAFRYAIKKLRAIQHEIDDVAQTAALELNRLRSRYNHWFENYKPFLKNYALEHAKVDKDGVKAKHYRDITSGGGVFFTARTTKTKFSNHAKLLELVGDLELAEAGGHEDAPEDFDTKFPCRNMFKKIEAIEVLDENLLIEACKALDLDPRSYGIEEGNSDPLGHMYVGTEKGWTPNKMKERLNKALEGELQDE
jgi:hypothetical protein